jgi:hypothetical protein
MSALDEEIKAVRASNPSWTFEETFAHISKTQPCRFTKSAAACRLEAKAAPQKEIEARERFSKIESVAMRLMARDRSLTFGVALERVKLCLPGVQAEIEGLLRQSVKAVEPKPKPRMMLIRGSEGTYID